MPNRIISNECMNLIRSKAEFPFDNSGSRQLDDGNWSVPMSDETIERVQEHNLDGETFSDTIIRILSSMKGTN